MARVKICGLSTAETMEIALDAGADFVGLVFFPKSPRNVSIAQARSLAEQASGRAEIVALVVDPADELVGQIAAQVGPDVIQLHGAETPDRVREIGRKTGARTMKAIKVATRADAAAAFAYRDGADLILFDAKPPPGAELPGGNGLAFDWTALSEVAAEVDYMLSGGLNPENVRLAIEVTGAPAVDVSSGVESTPGVKDAARIRAFIAAAKDV
ncbi:MAG: phosphoribosylanthranilate isomerase [Pseudomonadota bacterium]